MRDGADSQALLRSCAPATRLRSRRWCASCTAARVHPVFLLDEAHPLHQDVLDSAVRLE